MSRGLVGGSTGENFCRRDVCSQGQWEHEDISTTVYDRRASHWEPYTYRIPVCPVPSVIFEHFGINLGGRNKIGADSLILGILYDNSMLQRSSGVCLSQSIIEDETIRVGLAWEHGVRGLERSAKLKMTNYEYLQMEGRAFHLPPSITKSQPLLVCTTSYQDWRQSTTPESLAYSWPCPLMKYYSTQSYSELLQFERGAIHALNT